MELDGLGDRDLQSGPNLCHSLTHAAQPNLIGPATPSHNHHRGHLIRDHAELVLEEPNERRPSAPHLRAINRGILIVLDSHSHLLNKPMHPLQLTLRGLKSLHFLGPRPIHPRASHYFTRSIRGFGRASLPARILSGPSNLTSAARNPVRPASKAAPMP